MTLVTFRAGRPCSPLSIGSWSSISTLESAASTTHRARRGIVNLLCGRKGKMQYSREMSWHSPDHWQNFTIWQLPQSTMKFTAAAMHALSHAQLFSTHGP